MSSQWDVDLLASLHAPLARVVLVPPAVDVHLFDPDVVRPLVVPAPLCLVCCFASTCCSCSGRSASEAPHAQHVGVSGAVPHRGRHRLEGAPHGLLPGLNIKLKVCHDLRLRMQEFTAADDVLLVWYPRSVHALPETSGGQPEMDRFTQVSLLPYCRRSYALAGL